MRLSLSISFSNFLSASETSLNKNNDAELNIFAISKLFIIKKTDKLSINFSQLFDNQYVLYSLKNFEKVEIFLTWWNETSYTIILKKRKNDFSNFLFVWKNSINFKNTTSSIQHFYKTANIFKKNLNFFVNSVK